MVPRPRIELGTHGFSVHCSTELSYLGATERIVPEALILSSNRRLYNQTAQPSAQLQEETIFHRMNKRLGGLLLVFTLLVVMHSAATPLFEAPDEVWHDAYVRWLAEGRGLPPLEGTDPSGANQEVAQPPLYYTVAALLRAPFAADVTPLFWNNPGFGYQGALTGNDNKNMLIHTARERWPWHGAALAMHVTRCTSLLFGLLTVLGAWALGRETFGDERGAWLTAAVVAFQPQFVFISGVISNDSAASALATWTLWSAVVLQRRGVTVRRVAVSGLLASLAMLCKTSNLALGPLLALALVWLMWRERLPLRAALGYLLLFGAITAVVGGWWYGRNFLLSGDPLGLTAHTHTLWGRPHPVSLWDLRPELPLLFRSFWAAYGWGHVMWPWAVYGILGAGNLAALWLSLRRADKDFPWWLALAWCGVIFAALLHWMQEVEAPHGRLLFPSLGAWALLTASGLRGKPRVARGILLFQAVIAALAPGVKLLPTFAPPRLMSPQEAARRVAPVDVRYADAARLIGTRVRPGRLRPGDSLAVTACWEGLRPMTQDATVFVHLIGPHNDRVAERTTYPGLGRFPTSLWPVGRAFCDVYRMRLYDWAAPGTRYWLEVGLFDAQSGERWPARHTDGSSADPPIVGQVVVPPDGTIPPLSASLTDTGLALTAESPLWAALRGYVLPSSAAAGATITVTLVWESLAPVAGDYTVFVHLWTPGAASPWAQDDRAPRDGWYPTSVWRRGDWVVDAHPLTLPRDLPPGRYPLWAGMYGADGTRLVARDAQSRLDFDLLPLGTLWVK